MNVLLLVSPRVGSTTAFLNSFESDYNFMAVKMHVPSCLFFILCVCHYYRSCLHDLLMMCSDKTISQVGINKSTTRHDIKVPNLWNRQISRWLFNHLEIVLFVSGKLLTSQ